MFENPMNKFIKKKNTNKSSPTHKSTNNKPKLIEVFVLKKELRLSCMVFRSSNFIGFCVWIFGLWVFKRFHILKWKFFS